MKLKTFKDIETLDMKERAFANSIRKEVIKWIKYYRKEAQDDEFSIWLSYANSLKEFFNITEKEIIK